MLPAERLEGEESADYDEGEDEGAVSGSLLAAHPGLLHPKHGFNFCAGLRHICFTLLACQCHLLHLFHLS